MELYTVCDTLNTLYTVEYGDAVRRLTLFLMRAIPRGLAGWPQATLSITCGRFRGRIVGSMY